MDWSGFEAAHAEFIRKHLEKRTGERRGRLERGHGHAEKLFLKNVWWPLRGNFDGLHPEYEVLDWRGRSYFSDFAFLPEVWRILFEVKGFEAHVADMDRKKFCRELNRETFLQGMGFTVVSFAYDDVAERPELCRMLLRMVLNRYESAQPHIDRLLPVDREIYRYAVFLARPIRLVDVAERFAVDHRTAVRYLHRLCAKGWLKPSPRGASRRVMAYELAAAPDTGLIFPG